MKSQMYLLNTTGNTIPFFIGGGNQTIGVRGDFGGTSIKLQWCETASDTDDDWFDVLNSDGSPLTFLSKKQVQVTLGVGYVRAVLTGGSGIAVKLVIAGALGESNKG